MKKGIKIYKKQGDILEDKTLPDNETLEMLANVFQVETDINILAQDMAKGVYNN